MKCFWETGCSDSARCQAFGECVADHQRRHKLDLLKPRTKRQFFDSVVKELNLDTSDPFTLLFANACALVDQRDTLRKERDQMMEYASRCRDDVDALKREIKDLEAELARR